MIQLCNERLKIEIAEPGTLYHGPRFDWSAFITQVTLDGRDTFCTPESLQAGEGSGGQGLCNEFGIFRPIDYDSTAPGEYFPKPGVGLLRRLDDEPYSFAGHYPIEPFPLHVEQAADAVTFQFEPLPCRGYEVRLKKTMRLAANELGIEYQLENVGTEVICTHEYNHNFLAINGAVPGPDYELKLDDGLELRHQPVFLRQEGNLVRWTETVQQPSICRTANHLGHRSENAAWQLRHLPSGASVSETLSAPLKRLSLWCAPHVVCPEVFLDIALPAGETMGWTRKYRFWNEESE